MIKFEDTEYLYLLFALLPALAVFAYFIFWRKRAIAKIGQDALVQRLMPEKPKGKHYVKFAFIFLALAAIPVALANPQMGTKFEKVKRQGIDVIVAIDVSNSMLAEDVKPNRIEWAKLLVSRLIDKMRNDRIGLIVFAGNAYVQMPITTDYGAAKLFLGTINPGMVPTQGTSLSDAIRVSMEAFDKQDKKYKTLIIITDGEDHEEEALEATDEATAEGIVIYTVGVGTAKGAVIPVYRNGQKTGNYRKDNSGSVVLSKLNETILQQIAVKGNGEYFQLSTRSDDVTSILAKIANLEKKEIEEREFTDFEDWFQIPVGIALVLLTLEFFLSERKNVWIRNWSIFKT